MLITRNMSVYMVIIDSMYEHCGFVDIYDAIAGTGTLRKNTSVLLGHDNVLELTTNHYGECAHFPLECSNKCDEKDIKRKDMETHLDVRPLRPLDCPYKDAGCTSKIPCIDMESHIKSNIKKHLLMVFKSHQELKAHASYNSFKTYHLKKKRKVKLPKCYYKYMPCQ